VDLEQRISLVASTWSPHQQLHPGNVAWHGTGCDGAPPADISVEGEDWFAEAWVSAGPDRQPTGAEVYAHFSPRLDPTARRRAWDAIRAIAATGQITLAAQSDMTQTVRDSGAREVPGPYFLMQYRSLHLVADIPVDDGYQIVRADVAGDDVRVRAHQSAWAPARINRLLGIQPTGNEPPSSFDHTRYRAMKGVSLYRPELDLVVLAPTAHPPRSRSGGSMSHPTARCSNPSELHPNTPAEAWPQRCARHSCAVPPRSEPHRQWSGHGVMRSIPCPSDSTNRSASRPSNGRRASPGGRTAGPSDKSADSGICGRCRAHLDLRRRWNCEGRVPRPPAVTQPGQPPPAGRSARRLSGRPRPPRHPARQVQRNLSADAVAGSGHDRERGRWHSAVTAAPAAATRAAGRCPVGSITSRVGTLRIATESPV
jgi:hypothetical protein